MGPLQVFNSDWPEGICLAHSVSEHRCLNNRITEFVWQELYGPPLRVGPSGSTWNVLQWVGMWITCEPITYFMLNGFRGITNHRITYNGFHIYINKKDIMTDLKGSEGPRNTLTY